MIWAYGDHGQDRLTVTRPSGWASRTSMRRPRLARGGICLSRLWRCYERDDDRLASAIQTAPGQDGAEIPLACASAEGQSHQPAPLDKPLSNALRFCHRTAGSADFL